MSGGMNENKKIFILFAAGVAAGVLVSKLLCGSGGIRDSGTGNNQVGAELSGAQQSATVITERIEKVEQRADSIREGISSITSAVEATGDEIRDCQQILEAVRRRGKIAETKD